MSNLRKSFNKAVIIGLATLTLGGVLSTNAQAQTQGYQQPVTVSQTQQVDDSKPWAGDPIYQQKISTIEQQSDLRISTYNSRLMQQKSKIDYQHTVMINREIQQGQRQQQVNRAHKQGWNFGQILTTASGANTTEQWYASQMQILQNQSRANILAEHNRVLTLEANLDNQYANQYLRADQLAQRQQQLQAAQQAKLQNAAATTTNAGGTLTPDQMHDQLVKIYQQKTLESIKAGKGPLDPAKYGLDKNDPDIQITGSPAPAPQVKR